MKLKNNLKIYFCASIRGVSTSKNIQIMRKIVDYLNYNYGQVLTFHVV